MVVILAAELRSSGGGVVGSKNEGSGCDGNIISKEIKENEALDMQRKKMWTPKQHYRQNTQIFKFRSLLLSPSSSSALKSNVSLSGFGGFRRRHRASRYSEIVAFVPR